MTSPGALGNRRVFAAHGCIGLKRLPIQRPKDQSLPGFQEATLFSIYTSAETDQTAWGLLEQDWLSKRVPRAGPNYFAGINRGYFVWLPASRCCRRSERRNSIMRLDGSRSIYFLYGLAGSAINKRSASQIYGCVPVFPHTFLLSVKILARTFRNEMPPLYRGKIK